MGHYAGVIAEAARKARGLTEKLMVGVKPETAARKPRFETTRGVVVIDTNHPTFILGHLAIYPARALALVGLDASRCRVPETYEPLYKAGAECKDDPEGRIYPSWDEVSHTYLNVTDAAVEALSHLDSSVLLREMPEERRNFLPRVGEAVNFYMNSHVMLHLGQFSAWRRCMGLASAM